MGRDSMSAKKLTVESGNVLIFSKYSATFEGRRKVLSSARMLVSLEMISRMVLPHPVARVEMEKAVMIHSIELEISFDKFSRFYSPVLHRSLRAAVAYLTFPA